MSIVWRLVEKTLAVMFSKKRDNPQTDFLCCPCFSGATSNPYKITQIDYCLSVSNGLLLRSSLIFQVNRDYGSMVAQMQERKQFVVNCKDCRRDVPSGVKEFPFKSIAVTCPLCGEVRRYLPSEVFLGRPGQLVVHQQRAGGR